MRPNTTSATRSRFLDLEVSHSGENLSVQVEMRRQPRARHFRLRVKTRCRALLTLPWNASYTEAEGFLQQNRAWLAEHLVAKPESDSLVGFLKVHRHLSIRGRSYELSIQMSHSSKRLEAQVNTVNQAALITLPANTSIDDPTLVAKGLRLIAKTQLDLRVCDLAERVSLTIPGVSVRDQESRWGSCSSSGRLSLNWRLILLPPVIQDYVIYHELAHLTEMNHSTRFWDLLHTYDPRAGRHDRELNEDWTFLMHFSRN